MAFSRLVPSQVREAFRWDSTAVLLAGVYAGMTVPFLAVIARDRLHATPLQIAFMTSAPFASYLFSLFWAARIERRGALPYLVGSAVAARGLLLAMAAAVNAPVFVLIVVASTMAAPVAVPAYNVVMREIYPDAWRGRLMGLVRIGRVAAAIVGALLAGWLLHALSHRVVFPIAAVIGIVGALCWLRLRTGRAARPPDGDHVSPLQALSTLWRDRRFAWYSAGYFIFGFGNLILSPVIPVFQVDVLKITPMWVGLLTTTSAALGGLLYYVWGRRVDERGPFRSLLVGFAAMAVVPPVYALAHHVPTLLIAAAAAGIAQPCTELSWINAVMRFGREGEVARYSALHVTLLGIRGLIAPWVGGALMVVWPTLRPIFWLGLGVLLVGWAVMAAFVWRHARPGSDLGTRPRPRIVRSEHPDNQ